MRNALTLVVLLAVLVVTAGTAAAAPFYAATTWQNDSVQIFDPFFNPLYSFSSGANDPNGVASIGSTLYVGHFASQQMVAFDLAGNELFRWSNGPLLDNLQGLAAVDGQLAIADGSNIHFVDPLTGALDRSISGPAISGAIEGLVYDGQYLWALRNNDITAIDPATGASVTSIANAASGAAFGGTGIALAGPNSFVLVGTNGTAYFVTRSDGSQFATVNTNFDMYGVTRLDEVIPEPGTLVLFGLGGLAVIGFVRRRSRTRA